MMHISGWLMLTLVQAIVTQENHLLKDVLAVTEGEEVRMSQFINTAKYYYSNQSSLKIFNTAPVAAYPALNTLLIPMMNNFVCKIYENVSAVDIRNITDMGEELSIPSAATGYILFTKNDVDIIPSLDTLRNINTNGRWLFFTSTTESYIQDLLSMAFDNQNMVNILLINYVWDGNYHVMYYYDPFSIEYGMTRGKLFHIEMRPNVTMHAIYTFLDQFTDRTFDLRGYEMLVDIYPRPMYAEPIYDRYGRLQRYHFIEGDIIQLLSGMMNFKIIYSYMNNAKMPGTVVRNGTAIHGLALIEYERVNYSAISRLILPQGLNNTAYLYPIEIFNAHFLVPKLYPINSISLSGAGLFDVTTIVMIWVSLLCCLIVRYVINLIEATQDNHPDVLRLASQVIGFQNGISQPIAAIKSSSDRLIIISCLIMYLTVGTTYQGLILAQLQEKDSSQINTLEQVLDSGLELFHVIEDQDIFKPDPDRTQLSVRNKIYFKFEEDNKKNNYQMIIDKCSQWRRGRQMAILMGAKPASQLVGYCYDKITGKDVLYMVPEIAATYQISQTVPKSSPFIHEVNLNIMRIFEVGLNDFADMEMAKSNYIERIRRYQKFTRKGMQQQKLVRLENLHNAFLTLIVSYSVAFLILLLEILTHRLQSIQIDRRNFVRSLQTILYET